MILSNVNIGTGPSAGDGDPLRSAFNTINQNFARVQSNVNALTNSVSSVAGRTGNVTLTTQDIVGINNYATISYVTSQVANASAANISSLQSNVAALQADVNTLYGNAGVQSATLATLTANAAVQAGSLATLTSNAASQAGELTTLLSNAAVQAGEIASLLSNAGSQHEAISSLQSNAAVQAGLIADLQSNAAVQAGLIANVVGTYSNSNVKSYLSNFDGNIIPSANVTYNLGSNTSRWKDLYLSGNTIYLGDAVLSTTTGGGISVPTTRSLAGTSGIMGIGTYTVDYTQTPGSTLTLSTGWQNTSPAGPGGYYVFDSSEYSLTDTTLTVTANPPGDLSHSPVGTWNLIETYVDSGDLLTATDIVAETITPGSGDLTVDGNLIVTGNLTVSPDSIHMGNLTMSAPDGNLVINGDLIPSANVTYSLGSPTAQWKDLYLSGNTIHLGGAQLSVSGGAIQSSLPIAANVTATNITVQGTRIEFASGGYIEESEVLDGNLQPAGYYGIALNSSDDGIISMNALDSNAAVTSSVFVTNVSVQVNVANSTQGGPQHTWYFDNNGGLTSPDGLTLSQQSIQTTNNNEIALDNGGPIEIRGYTSAVKVVADMDVSNQEWTFGIAGQLTLPGGTAELSSLADQVYLYSDAGGGQNSIDIVTNGDTTLRNQRHVKIISASQGSAHTWTFGNTGSLTFPDSTVQTTAWTGTVTYGNTIAIGYGAGISQGVESVAIGSEAGAATQGNSAVAIGSRAAFQLQGNGAVALGFQAGYTEQSAGAVAIGEEAGVASQGLAAVAIGKFAALVTQGNLAVAIGSDAGRNNQGAEAVAVGRLAGNTSQGSSAVSVGRAAGRDNQGTEAVGIGPDAGQQNQGDYAIAIGSVTAYLNQGLGAVAIGTSAGSINQGEHAIAIGTGAGSGAQGNNSIILNATGSTLDQTTDDTFTVKPIRSASAGNILYYDPSSGEITYSTNSGGGTYGDANVAAYLPSYTGNVGAGNLAMTNNVSSITFPVGSYIQGNTSISNRGGSIVLQPNTAASSFAGVIIGGAGRILSPSGFVNIINGDSAVTLQAPTTVSSATASTNSTTGALVVTGGVGIGGNLNIGSGNLTVTNNTTTGNLSTAGSILSSGVNGKIGYSAGGYVVQSGNTSGIILNTVSGNIQLDTVNIAVNTTHTVALTNNKLDANDIILVQGQDTNAIDLHIGAYYITTNTALIYLRNISGSSIGPIAPTLKFIIVKAPSA